MSYQANQPGTEISPEELLILSEIADLGTPGQALVVDSFGTGVEWIDFPDLTGYVPYIGATADLNLGTKFLKTDYIISPSSDSYLGLFYGGIRIKGGDDSFGGVYSYDPNNAWYAGFKGTGSSSIDFKNYAGAYEDLTANSYIKSGGTSSQFLKADGSLDSSTYLTSVSGQDHNSLGNLTVGDVHTQYALLAGRSGGQTLIGGTASGNSLTLRSTSNATRGKIIFGNAGTTAYDEVNNRFGVGTNAPSVNIHALTTSGNCAIQIESPTGTYAYERIKGNTSIYDIGIKDTEYSGALQFRPNGGTPSVVFQQAGNVGINSTAPGSKLSVGGNMSIGSTYQATAAPTNSLIIEGKLGVGLTVPGTGAALDTKAHFYGSGTSSSGRTALIVENSDSTSGAMIQMKNNSGQRLSAQISGTAYAAGASTAAFFTEGGVNIAFNSDGDVATGGTSDILFVAGGYASSNERMRIKANGNVGIGTTTISARLHVVSTTEQLRLGYDLTHYLSATVASTGHTTYATNAANAGQTFSGDRYSFGIQASGMTLNSTEGLTISRGTAGSQTQPYIQFDRNNSTAAGDNAGLFTFSARNSAAASYSYASFRGTAETVTSGSEVGSLSFWTGVGASLAARMKIYGADVGIGLTTAPSARLHIVSTTEQQRIAYDASNYFSTTVGSTGGVTFNAVGSGAKFTFSDGVEATTVKATTAGGYISSDGSTGATGTFTTVDLKTVTVKDGIITSIV